MAIPLEEFARRSLAVREANKEKEPKHSEKFLDKLPDELIERYIWPQLLILPPVNSVGRCARPLTREEHKEHIKEMIILCHVCRG